MVPVKVMTVNVGNLSLPCKKYLNNLCLVEVEERIAKNLKKIRPDIVALQEVLTVEQCKNANEKDPRKLCFEYQDRRPLEQARRLLGDDYSIVCDSRNGYTCLGVHISVGEIKDCPPGHLCRGIAAIDTPGEGCDSGFTVSSVMAVIHGLPVTIVFAHPQSTSQTCRDRAIRQIFETVDGQPPLASGRFNLLLGDFNLDPFRKNDISVRTWNDYVKLNPGPDDYRYHLALDKNGIPLYTARLFWRKTTFDYIVSNFAQGSAKVLGLSEGTERVDEGSGMDHFAVLATLYFDTE